MNHYIYETTNLINGKKYIGKRSCHCDIKDDKYLGSGVYFKKAVSKYGRKNFKKVILEVCDDEQQALEREKFYIEQFNACTSNDYYNIAAGGSGGYWSIFGNKTKDELELWKHRMSESRKGRIITEEWKQKIAETRQARGITMKGSNNPMWGKVGALNYKSKPLVVMSLDGVVLKEIGSLNLVNTYLNKQWASGLVSRVCLNKSGNAYGYLWLFKSDYDEMVKSKSLHQWVMDCCDKHTLMNDSYNLYNNTPVYKLDPNTLSVLMEYESIKEASKYSDVNPAQIARNCRHGCNTAGGFSWVTVSEYQSLSYDSLRKLFSFKYNHHASTANYHCRKVKCVTTGETFNSIKDAIKHFNLCKGANISAVCKGTRKSMGKHPVTGEPLIWEYC